MSKRMLIDAAHAEETRVVVVDGTRVEEFDFESRSKKQLKGNIYLAKVTRVEPSLQAAFVEYGGNRHGFLAFNEIHPDYYRIPVADRQALLAEEAAYGRRGGEDEDADLDDGESEGDRRRRRPRRERGRGAPEAPAAAAEAEPGAESDPGEPAGSLSDEAGAPDDVGVDEASVAEASESGVEENGSEESRVDDGRAMALTVSLDQIASPALPAEEVQEPAAESAAPPADETALAGVASEAEAAVEPPVDGDGAANGDAPAGAGAAVIEAPAVDIAVETVGGDEIEEVEPRRPRINRRYKIQEVIKRRQIMLVQVTKEERGNKGAALTTYLSLAGRYCVLMPNTARGGGISRKINSVTDRKRLKSILGEMDIPDGMAVIVRTAGQE